MRPNTSVKLTRYGRRCKAGLRYPVHSLSPALQHLPPRAAYLEPLGLTVHISLASTMKTFLQDHSHYVGWLAGLGLPLAVLLAGWLVTTSIESSKLESEYVKMALTILSSQRKDADGKVQDPTKDELALRRWAVRLLNKQSPEKFTAEEQAALIAAPTPLISPEAMEALQRAAVRAGIELLLGRPGATSAPASAPVPGGK